MSSQIRYQGIDYLIYSIVKCDADYFKNCVNLDFNQNVCNFFFLRNIISTSVAHLSCDMFHLVRLLFFDDIDGLLAEQLSRIISCIFGGHLLSIPEV